PSSSARATRPIRRRGDWSARRVTACPGAKGGVGRGPRAGARRPRSWRPPCRRAARGARPSRARRCGRDPRHWRRRSYLVNVPAPLAPSTPILAPWKNESQMPRRISRLGGTTFRRSLMTNAYSPAMLSERGGLRPPLDSPLLGDARLHEATVLRHHAAILDHPDSGPRELLGSRVVPDPELEPDRPRPPRQRQDLVGVARKVFGTTEDLDHVS